MKKIVLLLVIPLLVSCGEKRVHLSRLHKGHVLGIDDNDYEDRFYYKKKLFTGVGYKMWDEYEDIIEVLKCENSKESRHSSTSYDTPDTSSQTALRQSCAFHTFGCCNFSKVCR